MSWEMHEAAKKIAEGWYSELETTRKRNAVLERENAKLRELARAAWRCIHTGASCYDCRLVAGGCTLQTAMRELGVEGRRMNMPSSEVRSGEPVLVEVAIPLERIGTVRCDFDGIYHVQVFGEEVVTDEETYRRVVEARDAHLRRTRELGVES